jgi:hypothetical protein
LDQSLQTWKDEIWPAGQPVFAVMFKRKYRWVVAGNVTVTVGAKLYVADAETVVQVLPLALPSTDSVWFRAPHDAGSWSTSRLALCAEPRSTCTHCGNALFALSQYVFWSASVTLPGA